MRPRPVHEALERRALLAATPQGDEFHVNQFTTGGQVNSAVAMDNAGNFVVVWQSSGQDGSGYGVYAQRYSAAGVAQGAEFRVNEFTTGAQQSPAVAMDDDGDFVIAWSSVGQEGASGEVWARRFTATGAPLGPEFHVNQVTTNQQLLPSVAMDGAGNFVIAWTSGLATAPLQYDIYARRYNASGTAQADEFQVNVEASPNPQSQIAPAVAMDTDGDFVVAWQDAGPSAANADVFARRFDQAGVGGAQFLVNQVTANAQRGAAVATDGAGNFVIAWESNLQDTSGYGVYARRFSAAGTPLGDEFRANTATFDAQRAPAVAVDDGGDFTIAWTSRFQDGSGYGVYAQSYTAAGTPDGTEFRVNTFTTGTQFNPAIAYDGDADFVVTWQSDAQEPPTGGSGIFAQRYGTTPGGEGPMVTNFTFHWEDATQGVRVTFDSNVQLSLGPDDLVLDNVTTMTTIPATDMAVAYDVPSNTATFTFPNYQFGALPDGKYHARLVAAGITDAGGTPMAADFTSDFFFLMGDANRDMRVNLQDFNRLASNFGQFPRDFSQADFNYDGTVNLQDFNLLAGRFGAVLTAPAAAARVAPPAGAPARPGDDSDRMIDVVD